MRVLLFLMVVAISLQARQCSAKSGRSLYTDEQLTQGRANIAKFRWAAKQVEDVKKSVEWVLAMPDDELWEFIPPAEQPRALNVRFGFDCPVHGKEIFKKGGHYPWIMDREHPFKVKCPVGGETYPSNDFETYYKTGKKDKLDTHQKYVDDGYGWIDSEGNRYWFVAHYIFWQRWRTDILPVIPKLASIYFLTGDTSYAHKAAVMLARIATEYPKMDYTKQAYHNGDWPATCRGKILDYCWEGDGTVTPLAMAYDQIYDSLDSPETKAFLGKKGIPNSRNLIEQSFLQEAAKAVDTGAIRGNMNYQEQLAIIAAVLDNNDPAKGYTTKQMIDWIMHGPGEMNLLLTNGISRDGAPSEESIGYSTIWTSSFYDLAGRLKSLGYDLYADPRMRKMADFYIQTMVAGKFAPRIGDCGGDMVAGLAPVWVPSVYSKAYGTWRDPLYARVLNRIGWPKPDIYDDPDKLAKVEKTAHKLGKEIDLKTRDMGGYGLAVLETGDGDNRRAVSMFYGSSGAWHGHLDRLNIEMWAHGRCVLPEMGYPAHWGDKADYWTRSTPSHYCVQIDENCQTGKMEGHLNLLASSPEVQVMDASGENAYRGIASTYRRTVAMVDASPEDSYLIDIFRVKGGQTHDYLFHGLPFAEFSVSGLDLGPAQTKGTLMGEDVEFGAVKEGMKNGGYQFLTSPRRGNPTSTWSANWLVKDDKAGLRMTMLPGSAGEVIVADGEPEARPGNPDRMEFVLARHTGGSSAFVSIIEPYSKKPFIRRVQPMSGPERDDLAAVRVDSKGRTDYIISAITDRVHPSDGAITDRVPHPDRAGFAIPPAAQFEPEGITFAGEFGSITMDGSNLSALFLVNGAELRKGDYAIRPSADLRAKIASVDFINNTVTLNRKLPISGALIGQVAIISNKDHSASYTITKVTTISNKTVLHFGDISLIEGIAELKGVDDKTKLVESSNRFTGYGVKWMGKLLPGRALVNEAKTASWRITDYDSGRWIVDSQPGELDKEIGRPEDGKRTYFYLGEASVGDDVMIPASVSIRRTANGTFDAEATVPFELTLPGGKLHRVTTEMLKTGVTTLEGR